MNPLRKLCRGFGFDVVPYVRGALPADMDAEAQRIIRTVKPYTMTSPERLFGLIESVRYLVRRGVAGDFVECGVWRGGSMMAAALTLQSLGATDRELFPYDTFEGMPKPTDKDVSYKGSVASEQFEQKKTGEDRSDWCLAPLDEVRRAVESTGYPAVRIHLVQGKVEDTLPAHAPARIALLRLDTDWYESTKHELEHLYPRLAGGGVLIVDDYGWWEGCRKAVDEYIAREKLPILLNRVDLTGRVAVKP